MVLAGISNTYFRQEMRLFRPKTGCAAPHKHSRMLVRLPDMPVASFVSRASNRYHLALLVAGMLAISACSEPPSWQKLLGQRINQQYPNYKVTQAADGNLKIERPGLPDATVDVAGIELLCRRGPKDCNYATDQMLISLQGK